MKYRCPNCGFVYDPEEGNSHSGILPNTQFGELPEGWVCPNCGAGKEFFEELPE